MIKSNSRHTTNGTTTISSWWRLQLKVSLSSAVATLCIFSGANLDEAIKFENIVEFFKAEGHNLIAFGDVDTRAYHR